MGRSEQQYSAENAGNQEISGQSISRQIRSGEQQVVLANIRADDSAPS